LAFVGKRKLRNFSIIVDLNGLQAMGKTDEIQSLDGLPLILQGFGFDVDIIDGHSVSALRQALLGFKDGRNSRPLAMIAQTVKGKGISFMENRNEWHYGRLDQATYDEAVAELEG
jgi:transketolase